MRLKSAFVDDVHQRSRQIFCCRGSAHLVEHHLNLWTRVEQTKDGFGEILAVGAIQPSGAHNDVLTARRHNGLFALKFCTAIDASWRTRLVFSARSVVGLSTKHIVRGNMQQPSPSLLSDLCHVVHSLMVEQVRQFLLNFSGINVGEGSTVDDYFDIVLRHHLRQGCFVGDV